MRPDRGPLPLFGDRRSPAWRTSGQVGSRPRLRRGEALRLTKKRRPRPGARLVAAPAASERGCPSVHVNAIHFEDRGFQTLGRVGGLTALVGRRLGPDVKLLAADRHGGAPLEVRDVLARPTVAPGADANLAALARCDDDAWLADLVDRLHSLEAGDVQVVEGRLGSEEIP